MTTDQQPLKTPMPERVAMEHTPAGLVLTYTWFSWRYVALALFALFWDGFLVFWYSMALSQDANWIMFVFPLLHVSVGVGVTYTALAGFYNKTVITVGMGRLTIVHTPLPWPGNKDLSSTELNQLYSEQRIVRSKNGTRIVYQLSAISSQGKKIKLVSGLNSPDEVRFLEQRIEEQIGIKDQPVEGEMAR